MDFEKARFNMVQQQVRPWDVLDSKVLELMAITPREHFVPKAFGELAFSDTEIPIGKNQVMLSPKVVGRLLQGLAIQPNESVLEIGTGTGYLTALLARLAYHVASIEIVPELLQAATQNLSDYPNIVLESGDAMATWDTSHSFDIIVFTGSLPQIPDNFKSKLNMGGRLFAIVGEEPVMSALLITRKNKDIYETQKLFETSIPQLLHAPLLEKFEF